MSGHEISGVLPQIRNPTRHDASGLRNTTMLAATPPRGIPIYAAAMLELRDLDVLASAASAIRLGIAPPRPSPVRSRAKVKDGMSGANDVRREKTPNVPSEATSTAFRPMRSATKPPTSAPTMSPAPLALKKNPSALGAGWKS